MTISVFGKVGVLPLIVAGHCGVRRASLLTPPVEDLAVIDPTAPRSLHTLVACLLSLMFSFVSQLPRFEFGNDAGRAVAFLYDN